MIVKKVSSVKDELNCLMLQEKGIEYIPVFENYQPVMGVIKKQDLKKVKDFVEFIKTTRTVCTFEGESPFMTDLRDAYTFIAKGWISG